MIAEMFGKMFPTTLLSRSPPTFNRTSRGLVSVRRMLSMLVREETDDGKIAHLRMTHPERLNALSDGMLEELQLEFDSIANDSSVRVVILSGEGKAFCAGHDLKEMSQTSMNQSEDAKADYYRQLFRRCSTLMQTIQEIRQPVIAQVHGVATAAGCQLVATCDLAVAAQGSRFGVNGIDIGLFCTTPMVALTRNNLPRKRVFEMLTTGRLIEAEEAADLGLVNKVVPVNELEGRTYALAKTIASKSPLAVGIGKQAFNHLSNPSILTADAYTIACDVMVDNLRSPQTQEGIEAFLGKRKPDWT